MVLACIGMMIAYAGNAEAVDAYKKGNLLFHKKQYGDAIKAYESIVNPSVAVYYNMARAYDKKNQKVWALLYLKKAQKYACGHMWTTVYHYIESIEKELDLKPSYDEATVFCAA